MRKAELAKPLFILAGICLALFFLSACREELPRITTIYPRIGVMGDVLTIHGTGFGTERNLSFITIAGTPPTSAAYISWSNEEIVVRTPEFGSAGLVYVHRGRQRSNPALFANKAAMPAVARTHIDNGPRVASIQPASGPVGSLITISGGNFGSARNNSAVFFSWTSAEAAGPGFIEISEMEFGYELWSDREIRVRVPDGAVSGNLEIRTPRGYSQQVFFTITEPIGTKVYHERRTFSISHTVDIQVERASSPNALFLWMPQPVVSSSQRNVKVNSRNTEPFIENFQGAALYHFIDTAPGTGWQIAVSHTVDVYAVETNIRNVAQPALNRPSPVRTAFVLPSPLVPSNDPAITTQATAIIVGVPLPFARAQRIFQWIISNIEIQNQPLSGGVIQALEDRVADSYQAALLFSAFARAVGIPAVPVAGVLIDDNNNAVKHYWAEFWLDGFGWVPLDPALGAGAAPPGFTLRQDHAQFYFGNMDNRRIAFSRGEAVFYQMTPHGRTVQRGREFSFQNIWEEATGGLESYYSRWSNVTITEVY